MDFVLGRQRGTTGAAAAVGYIGNIYINFTRNIAESSFEEYFCEQLRELGIEPINLSETRSLKLQQA